MPENGFPLKDFASGDRKPAPLLEARIGDLSCFLGDEFMASGLASLNGRHAESLTY